MTSRGDKYLGGRDFDKEITKLMKKKYFDIHNVKIDIENNKEYIHKAEEVKKILSVKDKASIEINGPNGSQKIEITQEEFEEHDEVCMINECKHIFKKNELVNWLRQHQT